MSEMNISTPALDISVEDVIVIEEGCDLVCHRFFIDDRKNVPCDPFPHTQELRLYGDDALLDLMDSLNAYAKRRRISRSATISPKVKSTQN